MSNPENSIFQINFARIKKHRSAFGAKVFESISPTLARKLKQKIANDFFEESNLNLMNLEDLVSISVNEYLQFLSHQTLSDEFSYISKYINWYLKSTETTFLSNQICDHTDFLYSKISFSPNCSKYVCLGVDRMMQIKDFSTKEYLFYLKQNSDKCDFTFSFDSERLLVLNYSSLDYWDISNQKLLNKINGKFSCMVFSKNEYYFAYVGLKDYSLEIYNDMTKLFPKPLKVASREVTCLDFSHDLKMICVGSLDGIISLWSITEESLIKKKLFESSPINILVMTPKETHIIAGTRNNLIFIWDLNQEQNEVHRLNLHKSPLKQIICSPDQTRFASLSQQYNMIIWDFEKKEVINSIIDNIPIIAVGIKDNNLITSTSDSTFLTWDFFKGKILEENKTVLYCDRQGTENIQPIFSFSKDGTLLVRYHPDPKNLITYWSPDNGEFFKQIELKSSMVISHMAFSLDNKYLAVGFENNVAVYDVEDSNKIVMNPSPVGVKLSSNSQLFWAQMLKKQSIIQESTEKRKISFLGFLKDGLLCAGDTKGTITLWSNIESQTPDIRVLEGHVKCVTFAVINHEENLLATGSASGTIRVWELASFKRVIEKLSKHECSITTMIFMKNSDKLISGCSQGFLNMLRLKNLDISEEFPQVYRKNMIPKFMNLTEDHNLLIVGYQQGEIIVWTFSQSKTHPEIYFLFETYDETLFNAFFSSESSTSNNLIINTMKQTKKIQLWSLNSMNTFPIKNAKYATSEGELIFAVVSADGMLLSQSPMKKSKKNKEGYNNLIRVFNGFTGAAIEDLKGHKTEILFIICSKDDKLLVSGDVSGVIFLWILPELTVKFGPINTNISPVTASFSANGNYLALGDKNGYFSVWDTRFGTNITSNKAHDGKIVSIDSKTINEDESFWASGGNDLKIIIWNGLIHEILFSFNEVFEDRIVTVKFWDNKLFVAGSNYNQNIIKCWDLQENKMIQKTLLDCYNLTLVENFDKILTFYHSEKNLFHLMLLDKQIIETDQTIVLDLPISDEEGEAPLQTLWVAKKNLLCIFDNRVVLYKFFFRNEDVFMREIVEICNFCRKPEDPRFKNKFEAICSGDMGTIFPFMYNILQAIAYTDDSSDDSNLLDSIFDLLEARKKTINLEAFFEKDIHGRNIFDVLFFKKNSELLKTLIDYIIREYPYIETNRQAELLKYFTVKRLNEMLDIFVNDPITMGNLLNYLFTRPINFPQNYVYSSLASPILTSTLDYKINSLKLEEILKKVVKVDKNQIQVGNEIIHGRCLFLSELLDIHNSETNKFYRKISNYSPTDELFANFTLVKLFEYKWELYGRRFFLKEAFTFMIFLIILIINTTYLLSYRIEDVENGKSISDSIYLQLSLILDIILFGFLLNHIYQEVIQLYYFSAKEYFESIWNSFDVILALLTAAMLIIDFFNCFQVINEYDLGKMINSLTIFFSFLRLISYARGIDGSAFMVRLIIQVIIDMRYFLLFLYLLIMGLGYAGYEIEENFGYSHFTAFNTFFKLMMGDTGDLWDMTPDNYYVLYFFFVVASILLPVTMLNLLISIISETFGKVRDSEKLTRVYERCNVLAEIDILESKTKKQNKKTVHLLYLYNESHEINTKTQLDVMIEKSEGFQKIAENIQKNLKEFSKEIKEKIFEEKNWMKNNFKRIGGAKK